MSTDAFITPVNFNIFCLKLVSIQTTSLNDDVYKSVKLYIILWIQILLQPEQEVSGVLIRNAPLTY